MSSRKNSKINADKIVSPKMSKLLNKFENSEDNFDENDNHKISKLRKEAPSKLVNPFLQGSQSNLKTEHNPISHTNSMNSLKKENQTLDEDLDFVDAKSTDTAGLVLKQNDNSEFLERNSVADSEDEEINTSKQDVEVDEESLLENQLDPDEYSFLANTPILNLDKPVFRLENQTDCHSDKQRINLGNQSTEAEKCHLESIANEHFKQNPNGPVLHSDKNKRISPIPDLYFECSNEKQIPKDEEGDDFNFFEENDDSSSNSVEAEKEMQHQTEKYVEENEFNFSSNPGENNSEKIDLASIQNIEINYRLEAECSQKKKDLSKPLEIKTISEKKGLNTSLTKLGSDIISIEGEGGPLYDTCEPETIEKTNNEVKKYTDIRNGESNQKEGVLKAEKDNSLNFYSEPSKNIAFIDDISHNTNQESMESHLLPVESQQYDDYEKLQNSNEEHTSQNINKKKICESQPKDEKDVHEINESKTHTDVTEEKEKGCSSNRKSNEMNRFEHSDEDESEKVSQSKLLVENYKKKDGNEGIISENKVETDLSRSKSPLKEYTLLEDGFEMNDPKKYAIGVLQKDELTAPKPSNLGSHDIFGKYEIEDSLENIRQMSEEGLLQDEKLQNNNRSTLHEDNKGLQAGISNNHFSVENTNDNTNAKKISNSGGDLNSDLINISERNNSPNYIHEKFDAVNEESHYSKLDNQNDIIEKYPTVCEHVDSKKTLSHNPEVKDLFTENKLTSADKATFPKILRQEFVDNEARQEKSNTSESMDKGDIKYSDDENYGNHLVDHFTEKNNNSETTVELESIGNFGIKDRSLQSSSPVRSLHGKSFQDFTLDNYNEKKLSGNLSCTDSSNDMAIEIEESQQQAIELQIPGSEYANVLRNQENIDTHEIKDITLTDSENQACKNEDILSREENVWRHNETNSNDMKFNLVSDQASSMKEKNLAKLGSQPNRMALGDKFGENLNSEVDKDISSKVYEDINYEVDEDANSDVDKDIDSEVDEDINSEIAKNIHCEVNKDINSEVAENEHSEVEVDKDVNPIDDKDVNSGIDKTTQTLKKVVSDSINDESHNFVLQEMPIKTTLNTTNNASPFISEDYVDDSFDSEVSSINSSSSIAEPVLTQFKLGTRRSNNEKYLGTEKKYNSSIGARQSPLFSPKFGKAASVSGGKKRITPVGSPLLRSPQFNNRSLISPFIEVSPAESSNTTTKDYKITSPSINALDKRNPYGNLSPINNINPTEWKSNTLTSNDTSVFKDETLSNSRSASNIEIIPYSPTESSFMPLSPKVREHKNEQIRDLYSKNTRAVVTESLLPAPYLSTSKFSNSPKHDPTKNVVFGVCLCDFNHTRGPEIEYWIDEDNEYDIGANPSDREILANKWPVLPFQALPDGSHEFEETFSYFNILYDEKSKGAINNICDVGLKKHLDNYEVSDEKYNITNLNKMIRNNMRKDETAHDLIEFNETVITLWAISCVRQISSDQLANKSADVTRTAVQKGIVIICRQPIFGQLKEKLSIITKSLFLQQDFTDKSLLKILFENLRNLYATDINSLSLKRKENIENSNRNDNANDGIESNLKEQDFYVGLRLKELIHKFRRSALVIFKSILLERKILFFSKNIENLCLSQFSFISLIPNLISNLNDSGSPYLNFDELNLIKSLNLKTSNRYSFLGFLGLPLLPFGFGGVFNPYTPLQQLDDLLKTLKIDHYTIGTSNDLLLGQKEKYCDVLVNLDTGLVEIIDKELVSPLTLSSADKKFIDLIIRNVDRFHFYSKDPNEIEEGDIEYNGSDDYIRIFFEEYLLSLLSAAKYDKFLKKLGLKEANGEQLDTSPAQFTNNDNSKMILDDVNLNNIDNFNTEFISEWLKTLNYNAFDLFTDNEIFYVFNPLHVSLTESFTEAKEDFDKNYGMNNLLDGLNLLRANVQNRFQNTSLMTRSITSEKSRPTNGIMDGISSGSTDTPDSQSTSKRNSVSNQSENPRKFSSLESGSFSLEDLNILNSINDEIEMINPLKSANESKDNAESSKKANSGWMSSWSSWVKR